MPKKGIERRRGHKAKIKKKQTTNHKNQESGFLHRMPISLRFLIVIHGGLQYRKRGKKRKMGSF